MKLTWINRLLVLLPWSFLVGSFTLLIPRDSQRSSETYPFVSCVQPEDNSWLLRSMVYVVLHSSLVRTNREDTYVYIWMLSIPTLTHLLAVHQKDKNPCIALDSWLDTTLICQSLSVVFLSHCYTGQGAGIAATNSLRLGLASSAAVLFVSHEMQLVVSPQEHSESFTVCVCMYTHITQCIFNVS